MENGLLKGQTCTFVCRDCKKIFKMTVAHVQWYLKQGLKRPERCSECLVERREARIEVTENVEVSA